MQVQRPVVLTYRRVALGLALPSLESVESNQHRTDRDRCRLSVGDTAECHSALQGSDRRSGTLVSAECGAAVGPTASAIAGSRLRSRAFTLIEIMIVVALIGIIMMTGMPPFVRAVQQEGMRKALTDVAEACGKARTEAVITGKPAQMTITGHSVTGGKFSGMIPEDVTIISMGVSFVEYVEAERCQVNFYPTGISDEFEITLQGPNGEVRQINLDIVTGTPIVSTLR